MHKGTNSPQIPSSNVLHLLNLELFLLHEWQVNQLRNIVEKKDCLWKILDLSAFAVVFNSWVKVSISVILVVLPLNALMWDQ